MRPHIIPRDALRLHMACVGQIGSGKSGGIRADVVEPLIEAGERVGIIDPTNVWWGLRLDKAGRKASGLDVVVFGEKRADYHITPGMGRYLGRLLAQSGFPWIVSIAHFTRRQQHEFMYPFLEALYDNLRSSLHLVVDEAHQFAPQKPPAGVREVAEHFARIVQLGRAKGFRVVMITQRPAILDKDVLSQAGTLVAMKLTLPADRRTIAEWVGSQGIGGAESVFDMLPKLRQREGLLWYPETETAARVHFSEFRTFDSSKAPETSARAGDLLPLDAAEITAALTRLREREGMPEQAEPVHVLPHDVEIGAVKVPRGTPLSVLVNTAQRYLEEIQAAQESPTAVQAAKQKAWLESAEAQRKWCIKQIDQSGLRGHIADVLDRANSLANMIQATGGILDDMLATLGRRPEAGGDDARTPGRAAERSFVPSPPTAFAAPEPPKVLVDASLDRASLAILWALRSRNRPLVKGDVAILAGYSPKAGHFNNTLGKLRSSGLISRGNPIAITPSGISAVGPTMHHAVGVGLLNEWLGRLAKAERDILTVVFEKMAFPKEDIAKATGYSAKAGHFNNSLGRLRSLGLILKGNPIRIAPIFLE